MRATGRTAVINHPVQMENLLSYRALKKSCAAPMELPVVTEATHLLRERLEGWIGTNQGKKGENMAQAEGTARAKALW